MPTNRRPIVRHAVRLTEPQICELLTLEAPLAAGEGFWAGQRHEGKTVGIPRVRGDLPPGGIVAYERDIGAMESAWQTHESTLLGLWIAGWRPGDSLCQAIFTPGRPGTRPPGWWRFRGPKVLPDLEVETEREYLESHGLLLPEELDLLD
jgi:hypothetical protein